MAISCQRNVNEYRPELTNIGGYSAEKKKIILSIHPLHNAVRIQEMYGPIIKMLEKKIPEFDFYIESSKSYDEFNKKIQLKQFDIILPNPFQTIMAMNYGYKVFAKMGDDEKFRGIVLVRRDSNIDSIKKLKNKTISFPAPTALAAAMMPQYYIEKNGASFKKDNIKSKYVGSQESSILAAYHKEVDAGATWIMAWESFSAQNAVLVKELKPLFVTEKLINNSLMAKSDLSPYILSKIKNVFLQMHKTKEGVEILNKIKLSKFEDASDKDYEIVQAFLNKYQETFGVIAF